MRTLADVITPEKQADGTFTIDVPDGFQQGRGAYGGLVLGALANAMVASENDDTRLLRSLTGEIPAPLPVGRATIVVSPVRRGSGASTVMARIEADGIVCGVATGVLGRARGFEATLAPPRPPPPAFASAQEVPVGPPFGPRFATMLEYRPTGPLPFTGVEPAVCEGWVRVRERGAVLRFADLVCLADAYWPAVFTRLAAPRPMATITFAFQALVDPRTLDPDAPLFHAARALGNDDGYVAEIRELYTESGQLVGLNQQTFAVLG